MSIATNLAKLGLGVSTTGVIAPEKGGTGTITGGGSSGPKITAITLTDSSYNVLDDTAVALAGGYIKITGSGFETGCQVLVGTTPTTSVTFISSTEVRVQVPATTAGTYIVYLVNSDGGVAIRVSGITFSATPTWTTESPLAGVVNSAISIQLAATGATTFSVVGGSSLPSGVSLSSSGLLTGTVAGISGSTTYNFTVLATDAELQDSPKTFAFNISVGDPNFKYTTLLLSANGTNATQNNTFVDSSTNNFAITRTGNTTQGTFSPYGPNWSNYFDGASQLSFSTNSGYAFGTGDFTVECWYFATSNPGYRSLIETRSSNGTSNGWALAADSGGTMYVYSAGFIVSGITVVLNTWNHVAFTRSGATQYLFLNGVLVSSTATARTYSDTNLGIGGVAYTTGEYWTGYLSNVRLIKGTCLYTTTFTPSTTPLTAVSNTTMLTCQSNRFIDNSTTNATITAGTGVTVQRFSPFSSTTEYSASTIGGSAYFDGTGDYLTIPSNSVFQFGTGDFSIECWFYDTGTSDTYPGLISSANGWQAGSTALRFNNTGNRRFGFFHNPTGDPVFYSTNTFLSYQWHHVAVTRSGSTMRMFVNGIQEASANVTASISLDTTTGVIIGSGFDSSSKIKGYVSNVRIVKGTAVYTSAFTPPTAPVTAVANTSLLTNFTNAIIIDSAMMNNIETVGNTQISTAQSKFGGSSIYFDGAGDYCFLPRTSSFLFSSGDFTIELWTYISNTTDRKYILGPGTDTGSHYKGFGLEIWGQQLSLWMSSNGTGWNMIECDTASNRGSTFMATNTWYHIAVTRSGNTVRSFINGVLEKTFTVSGSSFSDPNIPYNIGRSGYDPAGYFHYNGYMDDIRVTRGIARYTANFTPPTVPAIPQ